MKLKEKLKDFFSVSLFSVSHFFAWDLERLEQHVCIFVVFVLLSFSVLFALSRILLYFEF